MAGIGLIEAVATRIAQDLINLTPEVQDLADVLSKGSVTGAFNITVSSGQRISFAGNQVVVGGSAAITGARGTGVGDSVADNGFDDNTLLGSTASADNAGAGTSIRNVVIGSTASVSGNSGNPNGENVVVGYGASSGSNFTGQNTIVGAGASVGTADSSGTAVGFQAVAGITDTAVGHTASAKGAGAVAIGASSRAGLTKFVDTNAIAIGQAADALKLFSIAIGAATQVDHENTICFGQGATSTAVSQWVVGSTLSGATGILDAYWGRGVTNAAPVAFSWNGTGASGANVLGSTVTFRPGPGTGNSTPTRFIVETGTVGSSGSTPQSAFARLAVDSSAVEFGTDNGESFNVKSASQELTALSGASVSTTSLVPAGARLLFVVARVTTTITGATAFDVGDGTDVDRFGDDIALAAGTTVDETDATADPGGFSLTAQDVTLTAVTSDFTGGAVRITAFYTDATAPTS